jgi:RimJ/RimL family protein N-acetyltransferase
MHLRLQLDRTIMTIRKTSDVDLLGPWAWKLMGCGLWDPVGKSALGELDDDGEIKWACIYDHYEEGGSIQMHIAVDNPKYVTRQAICSCFEYPFYQLRVKKVLGIVNSENSTALTFDLKLGFRVETIIKDAYDMGSMYILSMTQEQCRWLRGKDNGWISKRSRAA